MQTERFEVRLCYDKTLENGTIKQVKELYLVKAVTISEAEEITINEMRSYISGAFEVEVARKVKFAEEFMTDADGADRWFKFKVEYITLDEKKGVEKKTKNTMLVQASDMHDALARFDEGMKGSMMDYSVASIVDAGYMDVFRGSRSRASVKHREAACA